MNLCRPIIFVQHFDFELLGRRFTSFHSSSVCISLHCLLCQPQLYLINQKVGYGSLEFKVRSSLSACTTVCMQWGVSLGGGDWKKWKSVFHSVPVASVWELNTLAVDQSRQSDRTCPKALRQDLLRQWSHIPPWFLQLSFHRSTSRPHRSVTAGAEQRGTAHIPPYCNSVFTGLPADHIARLQRVQNNAARLVLKKKKKKKKEDEIT